MPRVLVIIPALNEQETVADVITALRAEVPDYDILVVNDGSRDGTASIVETLDSVGLVNLPYNLGIGSAIQTGFKYAYRNGYDIAIQCDADGQHPAHQIPDLVARIEDGTADVVIGSRYVTDTNYQPSIFRRVGKSMMSRIVDIAIGGGITDTTSGFRATNRKALSLFVHHYPDDYPEAEALVILYKAGLKAVEIPVDMNDRQGGVTSIRPLKAAYYMVKVAFAIFVDLFRKYTGWHGDAH
jgi:hypothetical protein